MEQNYQPQGRDTTNGPHVHTYIPRSDGSIIVGGVTYYPQAGTVIPAPLGNTATPGEVPTGAPQVVPVAIKPGEEPKTTGAASIAGQHLPVQPGHYLHYLPLPQHLAPQVLFDPTVNTMTMGA